MGRRKKCEQIKRTNNVMVRFTDAEYASISISAEQAGYAVPPVWLEGALRGRLLCAVVFFFWLIAPALCLSSFPW